MVFTPHRMTNIIAWRACSMHREEERCIHGLGGETCWNETDYTTQLRRRIILKSNLQAVVWNGVE